MFIKQVSAFIENRPGRLAQLTRALGDSGVDIIAISIADTTNYGILRMIVSDPDKAAAVLRGAEFTVSITDVLAVEVPDNPGGLADILDRLWKADVSIEYLYSFVRHKAGCALIVFRVEENERTFQVFGDIGVKVLAPEQVYGL